MLYISVDPAHKIVLELFFAFKPLFLHQLLTVGAKLPAHFYRFVAAEVNKLVREQLTKLVNDVEHKAVGFFFAGAENVVFHAPVGRDLQMSSEARQMRIARNRRDGVTGNIKFRHNADKPFVAIVHDFANVFLGIKAAFGL